MASTLQVWVVAVRTPLHFLCASPLTSSFSTSVRDIGSAFGAERAGISILWVLLLDVNESVTTLACNLDDVAIAACPAMRLVLPVHELIAIPRAPLNFLIGPGSPLLGPGTTSMLLVDGAFGAIC